MGRAPSRRSFVAGIVALPAAFVAARLIAARSTSIRSLRPAPEGTSATRCALCGSDRHAMLRCPRAPEVT
jgi:hypothetical protein